MQKTRKAVRQNKKAVRQSKIGDLKVFCLFGFWVFCLLGTLRKNSVTILCIFNNILSLFYFPISLVKDGIEI